MSVTIMKRARARDISKNVEGSSVADYAYFTGAWGEGLCLTGRVLFVHNFMRTGSSPKLKMYFLVLLFGGTRRVKQPKKYQRLKMASNDV